VLVTVPEERTVLTVLLLLVLVTVPVPVPVPEEGAALRVLLLLLLLVPGLLVLVLQCCCLLPEPVGAWLPMMMSFHGESSWSVILVKVEVQVTLPILHGR
jgi:hypothetical protein